MSFFKERLVHEGTKRSLLVEKLRGIRWLMYCRCFMMSLKVCKK
ncbi:hypothetical protein HMPREF9374_3030 [Desmospora sp. 8437]|nr:hypothetical protein HMPREF9374_3030 [Desmospora sp. 8437]